MPHDKIKAAARKRTAETGEPYTAARRAVVTERQDPEGQAAVGQIPPARRRPACGTGRRMRHVSCA